MPAAVCAFRRACIKRIAQTATAAVPTVTLQQYRLPDPAMGTGTAEEIFDAVALVVGDD